jgi:hypothetical protein
MGPSHSNRLAKDGSEQGRESMKRVGPVPVRYHNGKCRKFVPQRSELTRQFPQHSVAAYRYVADSANSEVYPSGTRVVLLPNVREQSEGFSLYMIRAVLGERGDEGIGGLKELRIV